MTELLSKEKEFLKLNEELNRMAASTAMDTIQTPSPPVVGTADSRFLTFQKNKGQSTLLKKRGAGDSVSGVVEISTVTTRATRIQLATGKGDNTSSSRPAAHRHSGGGSSPRSSVASSSSPTHSKTVGQSDKPIPNTGTVARKTMGARGNETFRSQAQTSSKTSSSYRASPTPNTATFTVKYRNPKFVQSPSLEVMYKDECSSIRNEQRMASKDSKALEFASSVLQDNVNTISRPSQLTTLSTVSKKNVSTDGLIKFLKSKISILEEDHSRISNDMAKHKELLERSLERSKILEQQRDAATIKQNALKDQLVKVEAQLDEASVRNKDRNKDQLQVQKELECVKREIKIMTQNNSNLEKRLNKATDELEAARKIISELRTAEKDIKEQARLDCDAKDKQIKSLKKQRADLLNAYKKQLFLIDNLKRQTVCLEQAKMISFGKKEFAKVLDYDMKS